MQKVEAYVGVPIFERTKNKLTLTKAGLELAKLAQNVVDAEKKMREQTISFYTSSTSITVGSVAPGPIIKYGNLFHTVFKNKTIETKIEPKEVLLEKLNADVYDFIFLSQSVNLPNLDCKFAFSENLYITVPKTHFLAGLSKGVYFKEIDGQSFLVANNLGIWDSVVAKNLPSSRLFPQSFDNLEEIINASTIPNFSTNITLPLRTDAIRVSIPILDQDATMKFYLVYKKQNKAKLKPFLNLITKNQ